MNLLQGFYILSVYCGCALKAFSASCVKHSAVQSLIKLHLICLAHAIADNNAVLGGAGGDGGDGNGNTADGGDFNSGDFSGNGGIAVGDNGNGGDGGDAIGGESVKLGMYLWVAS